MNDVKYFINRYMKIHSFPLLVKEMIELANRSQTYSVRILYAVIMYVVCFYSYYHSFTADTLTSGLGLIGTGGKLFEIIFLSQLVGICIFVPAITSTLISSEKESGNFPLLMITRLGPGKIVLEKLFSRMIHFGSVLLLALPLLAFAYLLGGVQINMVWKSSVLLFLCMLQLASFSIMCSAYSRNNMGAFTLTYSLGVLIQLFLPAILGLHRSLHQSFTPKVMGSIDGSGFPAAILGFLSAPSACVVWYEEMTTYPFSHYYTFVFGMIISSVVYFLLATKFMTSRMYIPTGSSTLKYFGIIDEYMKQLNDNSFTRGVVLIKDGSALPEDDPIAWRETTKTALGATRYLTRLLIAIELPLCVFLVFYLGLSMNAKSAFWFVGMLYYFFWALAVILIIAKAANLIAGEQANQTLDVLLTTPISTADILAQKNLGIKRLFWVLAIPVLTLFFVKIYLTTDLFGQINFAQLVRSSIHKKRLMYLLAYVLFQVSAVVIYFHIVMYIALWISLKIKNNMRTIILTIVILSVWLFGSRMVLNLSSRALFNGGYSDLASILLVGLALINPLEILNSNPSGYEPAFRYMYFVQGAFFIVVYMICLYIMRQICYRKIMIELNRQECPGKNASIDEDVINKTALSVESV